MLFEQPISSLPFTQWLRADQENRRLLRFSIIAVIVQFLAFKAFYPFPNFMPPDSSNYIEAAFANDTINFWAIGYSKFLRLFSSLTNSHIALVVFQYMILEASLLYFLLSIRYLLAPGIWTFRILIGISLLNPLVPHISNFVSSDCLFTALSLVWFTHLLWIAYNPSYRQIVWHAIILLLAFIVRHNALYFPFISIAVILLIRVQNNIKWTGIALILILLGGFIGRTQYEYYKLTGTVQYSAFGGWQLAANALYGYAHAKLVKPESIPEKFRGIHSVVNKHMDSLNHIFVIFRPDHNIGVYYLWDPESPLKVYLEKESGKDTITPYFNRWAAMGSLYKSYGSYLIFHHPKLFLKHFVWINFLKYYAPPPGFMEYYNIERDHVDPIVVTWFDWKNDKVYNNFRDQKIKIVSVFPVIWAAVNFIFLACYAAFAALGGFKECSSIVRQILRLSIFVWLSNMIFSVLSAPIELRYQLFPMLIIYPILCLLLSYLLAKTKLAKTNQKRREGNPQSNIEANVLVIEK
jgi:hypothetical protein